MAAYDYLLPKEKFALAHYIRTNFIPGPDTDSDADLQALDGIYNLSAGLTLAAQIPIKSASFLVISENESENNKVKSALSSLEKYQSENGYDVFNRVVKNHNTAFSFLVMNNNWRQSEQNFVNLVVNNVNQNGFNGTVFNLKNEEWSSLYSLMLKLI